MGGVGGGRVATLLAFFLVEQLLKSYQGIFFKGSYNVVVAGFKLTHLTCLPPSSSGIKGVCHHAGKEQSLASCAESD